MLFGMHCIHILLYLTLIVFSCYLFTNSIEHLGKKLNLGHNATGSILAVIGTTLPETIVPIVAIASIYIFGYDFSTHEKIALGAIIGSPFMLSCLGLFCLGIVLLIKKRTSLEINYENILRDYKYFLITYPLAIIAAIIPIKKIKLLFALILIIIYILFVYRTLIKSKDNIQNQELEELVFSKIFFKLKSNGSFLMSLQIIVSIICLIVFSRLFMDEIVWFSNILNISPLILSMVVTPFATELPECVNSIIWTNEKKDDLALANILGAIIFQSSILASIGIFLTSWKLDWNILANAVFVIVSSLIFISLLIIKKQTTRTSLLLSGLFYFGYLIFYLYNFAP